MCVHVFVCVRVFVCVSRCEGAYMKHLLEYPRQLSCSPSLALASWVQSSRWPFLPAITPCILGMSATPNGCCHSFQRAFASEASRVFPGSMPLLGSSSSYPTFLESELPLPGEGWHGASVRSCHWLLSCFTLCSLCILGHVA